VEASESLQAPVREGDILAGKYKVERVLGAGAMGIVVSAMHVHLGERVALKFLHAEMAQNQEVVARFLREAQSSVRIKGEHVCRVSDVGKLETGAPYMVMELLQGSDLGQILEKQGRLEIPAAVDFLIQACDALAEAHALGIVHRDLKPSNLFLTTRPDGSPLVKVLDFGVAKIMGDNPNVPKLTAAGAILGSPLYMSPEQLLGSKAVDARSDIWQLGIILFELVTGQPPFDGKSLTDIVVAIGTQPAPSMRKLRPEVPVAMEEAVYRCLEKDAHRRMPDVAALAEALLPLATTRRAHVAVENIVTMIRGAQAAAALPPMRPNMVSGHMLMAGAAEGYQSNPSQAAAAGLAATLASPVPPPFPKSQPVDTRAVASATADQRARLAETQPGASHDSGNNSAIKWALIGGGAAAIGTIGTIAALQFLEPKPAPKPAATVAADTALDAGAAAASSRGAP
jgi:tRNA A-37 threonylcarbamoyl transferase component Bud32